MSSGIVTGSRDEGVNVPGVLWPYSADTELNTKLDGNSLNQCSPYWKSLFLGDTQDSWWS